MKFCLDCNKEIKGRRAIRCQRCRGITLRKVRPKCSDCGKQVSVKAKRCQRCANIKQAKNNRNCVTCGKRLPSSSYNNCWECHDRLRAKNRFCVDCKKRVSSGAQRCVLCHRKHMQLTRVKRHCADCGREISQKNSYKKRPNKRCLECYWKSNTGQNSVHYIHGEGNFPYTDGFNDTLKQYIRSLYKHRCVICHRHQSELDITLNVHHIDYNKKNLAVTNLIPLCKHCHGATTPKTNRHYWQPTLEKYVSVKLDGAASVSTHNLNLRMLRLQDTIGQTITVGKY